MPVIIVSWRQVDVSGQMEAISLARSAGIDRQGLDSALNVMDGPISNSCISIGVNTGESGPQIAPPIVSDIGNWKLTQGLNADGVRIRSLYNSEAVANIGNRALVMESFRTSVP